MNKLSQFFTHNLYNLFLVGSLSSYLYIAFFIYEMTFYNMLPRICSFIVLFLLVNFYHLSPWLKKRVDGINQAKEMEIYHWKNDADLIFIKKWIRPFLWFTSFSCLAFSAYMLQKADQNLGMFAVYQKPVPGIMELYPEVMYPFFLGIGLLMADAFLLMVCNIHIAVCRNPLTTDFITKLCIECARFGVFGGIVGTSIAVAADTTMINETTTLANVYHTYTPLGRGYGFPVGDTEGKVLHSQLQKLPGYNPLDHVDPETKIMNVESQRQWIKDNPKTINKHLSVMNRQLIDAPNNSYGYSFFKK